MLQLSPFPVKVPLPAPAVVTVSGKLIAAALVGGELFEGGALTRGTRGGGVRADTGAGRRTALVGVRGRAGTVEGLRPVAVGRADDDRRVDVGPDVRADRADHPIGATRIGPALDAEACLVIGVVPSR